MCLFKIYCWKNRAGGRLGNLFNGDQKKKAGLKHPAKYLIIFGRDGKI